MGRLCRLARKSGRFLAGRPMDGERKTDATFWRTGTRVLPKVEGKVSRSSYRAGWQRLTFRIGGLAATSGGGYWALWENPDPALAARGTDATHPARTPLVRRLTLHPADVRFRVKACATDLPVADTTPTSRGQRAGRLLDGEAPRRQAEGFWPRNVSPLSILALFRANSRSAADNGRGAQPGRLQPSATFVMTSPLA